MSPWLEMPGSARENEAGNSQEAKGRPKGGAKGQSRQKKCVYENRGGRPDLLDLPFPVHGASLDRGSCKCVRDKLEHGVLSQGRIAEFGSRILSGQLPLTMEHWIVDSTPS